MIRGAHSRESSREPIVNFNEQPNRKRTYGSTRKMGSSYSNATGSQWSRNPTNNREGSIGRRPISNARPTREAHATGRGGSQTGITRTREQLSPATWTGGKFQSLKRQI